MGNTWIDIRIKVRTFFEELSWKKILTFSFFLILSSIFWFAAIFNQTFENTYRIPLRYVDVPDSIVFDNPLPNQISVKVEETGANLFVHYFRRGSDSLLINIRQNIQTHSSPIILDSDMEQMVRKMFLSNTRIVNIDPKTISLTNVPLEQKDLTVINDVYVELPIGHIISGDMEVLPKFVTAYGSRQKLDSLDYVYTANDSLYNITGDKTVSVKIRPIRGIKFHPEVVQLSIPVDEYTSKTVVVPVKCINLPPDLSIRFFPSTVSVTFFIGLKKYDNITADSFNIMVDYNDIKDLTSTTIPVRILDSPIVAQSLKPHEIEFILEQK